MLTVENLSIAFEGMPALRALDLAVEDGEIVAVMGPSGSGKSTLLRVIAGLQEADAGVVRWDGETLDGIPPHRRGFGLMFQDYALFPHKSVARNVEFGLRMQKWSRRDIDARTTDVLNLVGLEGYEDRSIGSLSGGEQQRVALARTLAPEPRLLLLDEPIGALDLVLRERLMLEMRAIFEHLDATVLYVTHDRGEAFAVADRVAVVSDGRVVADDTPQELWTSPGTAFVARFLGIENVYPVAVRDGYLDTGWLRIPGPTGSEAIAIPPDAVSLSAGAHVTGRVVSVRFEAGSYRTTIQVGSDAELIVAAHDSPMLGATVTAAIDIERVAFLAS